MINILFIIICISSLLYSFSIFKCLEKIRKLKKELELKPLYSIHRPDIMNYKNYSIEKIEVKMIIPNEYRAVLSKKHLEEYVEGELSYQIGRKILENKCLRYYQSYEINTAELKYYGYVKVLKEDS